MIRVCIFDCDGTLLDTLASIAHSANLALADFGFSPIPVEEYKKLVGDGAQELIRRCLKRSGDSSCDWFDQVYPRYRAYFAQGCLYEVKPYDGIGELLKRLKQNGIKLAVLSNKPHEQTEKVIGKAFPQGTFDAVLGFKPEIARKPSPQGAELLRKEFGVNAGECLYIGDTDTDMQTGNAAGMHTVGVLWGFRERGELERNHAEYIAADPLEIAKLAGQPHL